jgi:hypothetical protein
MRLQQFLEHHGIARNPFANEDAQTDPVFKEHCLTKTYHPSWDKIYGNPGEPSTSVVFGEKGAGKTALRLQIRQHLEAHNQAHLESRVWVIEYDDFNRFLDRFRDTLGRRGRRTDRMLNEWKLWDHMDAILALGVTQLVDRILAIPPKGTKAADDRIDVSKLDRLQGRDLLLLAACYDQSLAESPKSRWQRLRRKLRYYRLSPYLPAMLGFLVTLIALGVVATQDKWTWLEHPWIYLVVVAGWLPWLWRFLSRWNLARGVARQVRVGEHQINSLRKLLMRFPSEAIAGQPLPNKERTDDRYELLIKFQGILKALGYPGVIVLVDRVDEPHLINGSATQMRALLWPMLDNKFLKHPGIGFKLLLPIELSHFIDREDHDFYQRARLDKQNMVPSLEWTGEALYDVTNDRIRACSVNGKQPTMRSLFEPSISDRRLVEALRSLRVPRHVFKFLDRLFVAHAGAHTDENPAWEISSASFESTLALYQRDQDAFDRGVGAG